MVKISVVIITLNEERYIGRCLESVRETADEIIVVDSFSADKTEEICRSYDVKFVQHPFEGYIGQKNYGVSLASNDWILSLDADEALSDELKRSVVEAKNDPGADGYYVNRRNFYCGNWLRFSGWYPDRHMRLFNSRKGAWGGLNPHDKFRLYKGGKTGRLKGDLLHWYHESFSEHREKTEKFADLAADSCLEAGIRAFFWTPLLHGTWSFLRSYIIRGGFMDGKNGYMVCVIGARGSFHKYCKLRRLIKEKKIKQTE
jgi:glycosyltransferase involved in cell wall biosynthesis